MLIAPINKWECELLLFVTFQVREDIQQSKDSLLWNSSLQFKHLIKSFKV